MKKELISIIILSVLTFKTFALTGNANDGMEFTLVIIGLLLMILALFMGIVFLRKNGKTIIIKAMVFIKKKTTELKNLVWKNTINYCHDQ